MFDTAKLDSCIERVARLTRRVDSILTRRRIDNLHSRIVRADAWDESKHKRGQPGNAGQFGPGGFSGNKKKEETKEVKSEQKKPEQKKPEQKQEPQQRVQGKKSSEPKRSEATKLYKAPARSPEQLQKEADKIVAAYPGAKEAIQHVRERLRKGVSTHIQFKDNKGNYTAERRKVHKQVLNELFPPAVWKKALPKKGEQPVVTLLGGRGGSGKSFFTKEKIVDTDNAMLVDSDEIKKKLPGYEGWNAALFHEEGSDLLEIVAERAKKLGVNVVFDATLKSLSSSQKRAIDFTAVGYAVEGHYMHLSPEKAAERALSRFKGREGKWDQRFVPPEIVLGNTDNEKNFDILSEGMRKWSVYDNSGKAPRLVSKSED